MIGNKKAIKPILRDIIAWQRKNAYPLNLMTEASIDLAEDDEMLELMVEANFETVFVGIESPNEEALRETKKIQNLTDRSGTPLDKVHHIQRSGIEVVCGMIVGFDSDDESVFEAQRRFIHEARIVMATVTTLYAIPTTPLFDRMRKEGRLIESGVAVAHPASHRTNIVPLQMSGEALSEGFLRLMRDLYASDAYFARADALYFDTRLSPNAARRRYLRRHPWRWFKARGWATLETAHMFVQLMRLPDMELRREYRRRLWNVLRRRPSLTVVRAYCIKCALHFHYDRLIRQHQADHQTLGADAYAMAQAIPAAAE